MFELPEYVTIARQLNETPAGTNVHSGSLGNSPHRFVWYNRTHEEFAGLVAGKTVGSDVRHSDREDPVSGRRVLLLPPLPSILATVKLSGLRIDSRRQQTIVPQPIASAA